MFILWVNPVYEAMGAQLRQRMKNGDVCELEIKSRGRKGDGIAVVGGLTVIVPNAKVGERLKVRIRNRRETVAFAEIISRK